MRRAAVPVAVSAALGALVYVAFAPARFLNYDSEYALLWGNDLLHGRTPDYDVNFAPTPHPLETLVGGLLSVLGTGTAETILEVLAFVALGVLGYLVFALGRAWFGVAAGVIAAAIVLTREPVLSYGIRAYVDIPYICLLLGALLIETRRARAGVPVLALLAVAGLLRPEAWLFSVAYGAWLWRGGALGPRELALVLAAPLLWTASDWAITGEPLHSLTGTRETGGQLHRVTGLQHVPTTLPRRLGEILRLPVLIGAAGGGLLALWKLRERALLGAAAGVVAVAAFCVLAAAGLPILTRYLLLAGSLLAIFFAAGLCGWAALRAGDRWRAPWMAFAAAVALMTLAFVPSQRHLLRNTRAALITQTRILDELHDLSARVPPGAASVTVPNRRAVPQLALWTHRRPEAILSAQELRRYALPAFAPSSPSIAQEFVLDPRDRDKRLPPPPRVAPAARGRYWSLFLP